jgi:hypothetical protein
MTEQDTDQQESSRRPYVQLPVPVVAAGIAAFLAVLLFAGLFANANLRPRGVALPTPEPPPAIVESTAASIPTHVAEATPLPTSPPTAQLTHEVQPTAIAGTSGAAAESQTDVVPVLKPNAAPTTAAPLPEDTALAVPTVEPVVAAEIGRAYENFWRVKSEALLELDSTHLPDVMDGEYLSDTQDLIGQLRNENRAIKTQVSLNYSVVDATATSASVVDSFVDNSIYVKAGTEDALSAPSGDQLSVLYHLEKISDVWKVVQSATSQ